jgi:heptosyltransferase-1
MSSFFRKSFLPKELADPRRILLTHFGSTADIVRCLPVLVALRHRFPYGDIAWLIGEHSAPIVLDHWAVNRFIVVKHEWFKHLSEIRRVRLRLQSFAPQVVVDPQNSFGSSLAAWLSGAKYRIGFKGKQSRLLHNVRIVPEGRHRIEQNLQLLQPFGIFGSDVGFDMPECEKDRLAAQNILHRKGLPGNFALLYVSAESPTTRWREERFGEVAKYLLEQWNLPSLIIWSDNETESSRAEAAVLTAGGAALLAPWTTQVERKALAKLATVFIGSDTAELQIAAAVGKKCVGLFGTVSALENAPFGQEHHMIQTLHQKRRKHDQQPEGMDAITSEMVCEKCDAVLSEILQPQVVPMQQVAPVQKKAA